MLVRIDNYRWQAELSFEPFTIDYVCPLRTKYASFSMCIRNVEYSDLCI